jgi:hypothetical protein
MHDYDRTIIVEFKMEVDPDLRCRQEVDFPQQPEIHSIVTDRAFRPSRDKARYFRLQWHLACEVITLYKL